MFGAGDAPLRAMYLDVASLPFNQAFTFDGRLGFNFARQNKYWVVTGNGARITVSATSSLDVSVGAYRQGVEVGSADNGTTGTETFFFNSTAGIVYVINVTGHGSSTGNYGASATITSP